MKYILFLLFFLNFFIGYILKLKSLDHLSLEYKNKRNFVNNSGILSKYKYFDETGKKMLKILRILSFVQFILFVLLVIVQISEN